MSSLSKSLNFIIFPFLLAFLVSAPFLEAAEEAEVWKTVSVETYAVAEIVPRKTLQTDSEGHYVRPRLPENVIAAKRAAVMPQNEKIRILPLNTLRVPVAAVLAKPIHKAAVFSSPQVVQPAVSPVQTAAQPAPAAVQKKQS